jgi:polygalacturonase
MRQLLIFIFSLFIISACSSSKNPVYNILDFGAMPDGETLNTGTIQDAINACHASGGGTVYVPAGEFITGTIALKGHVNLHLSAGARLTGSTDTADYRIDGMRHGMIWAYQARNISITGEGTIDGRGTHFHLPDKTHSGTDFDRKYTRQGDRYFPVVPVPEDGPIGYDARPGMMIVLLQCEEVTIKDIKLVDSPEWTIRLGDCDDVLVTGISIHNNLLVPNSDGIHCTTSRNIRISDCDIRAGDDAIIVTGFGTHVGVSGDLKTELDYTQRKMGNKTGYAENIVITNCNLQSRSSGIRIGYGMNDMRNCVFSNLVIYESNRGIGVFARDEGSIENILFSDIVIVTRLHSGHWWGNGEPIHVSAIAQSEGIILGQISNIRFRNIMAKSETGILVYGVEESPITNLIFDQVQLTISSSPLADSYGGNFDLRPSDSLETSIFKADIPGLYAGYVNNLTIKDFNLTWAGSPAEYFTYGIHCTNYRDVLVEGFKGTHAHPKSGLPAIFFEKGTNKVIK